jgi:formyl-CoA transferase
MLSDGHKARRGAPTHTDDVTGIDNAPAPTPSGPLDGLRVIELGQLLAGPFCGQLLGDFGADVIKVEDPGRGDPMRQWGREKWAGNSLWWPIVARNKRSVTLNLRSEDGQRLLRELVSQADVLIENFRPGTLERWGLGPDVLWELNPRLVITRVSGYGQTGPYSSRAGYGAIGEALGGIRYTTGEPDRPPARTGISLGDSLAALFATIGTLVALRERDASGKGQIVDSAIYESVLALMESILPEWEVAGHQRERSGSVLPNIAPSNAYETSDGTVLIAGNQDTVFRRLAAVIGRPELAESAEYATHDARGRNQVQLDDLINDWTSRLTSDEVLTAMNDGGVPAGPVYRARDMLVDPHFAAREAIVRVMAPGVGEMPMPSVFPRLSSTPGMVRSAGPELGQDNAAVFRGLLGLSEAECDELAERGVI